MNIKKLSPILIALLIFGVIYFFSTQKDQNRDSTMESSETAMQNDSIDSEQSTQETTKVTSDAATYVDYTPELVTNAHAEGKRPVIFFHAAWCPTCKALEDELTSGGLEELPSDLVILKTDYDTELDLRKKYGVTIQHTLVQVDEQGNEVAKWVGGGVNTIKERVI